MLWKSFHFIGSNVVAHFPISPLTIALNSYQLLNINKFYLGSFLFLIVMAREIFGPDYLLYMQEKQM
ncbi:MAG: hypothetical protein ACXADC_18100 [Candidatus Thorarchaeota archaeon]